MTNNQKWSQGVANDASNKTQYPFKLQRIARCKYVWLAVSRTDSQRQKGDVIPGGGGGLDPCLGIGVPPRV